MAEVAVTLQEIEDLVVGKLAEVLAVEPSAIGLDARFDEDLHADSLDLVEVVESVEGRLRARGADARLGEDRLLALRTVGDAVAELHATFGAGAGR